MRMDEEGRQFLNGVMAHLRVVHSQLLALQSTVNALLAEHPDLHAVIGAHGAFLDAYMDGVTAKGGAADAGDDARILQAEHERLLMLFNKQLKVDAGRRSGG